jgi:hypothetical protein
MMSTLHRPELFYSFSWISGPTGCQAPRYLDLEVEFLDPTLRWNPSQDFSMQLLREAGKRSVQKNKIRPQSTQSICQSIRRSRSVLFRFAWLLDFTMPKARSVNKRSAQLHGLPFSSCYPRFCTATLITRSCFVFPVWHFCSVWQIRKARSVNERSALLHRHWIAIPMPQF